MKTKLTFENVKNMFDYLSDENSELKNHALIYADRRLGKKIAIAKFGANGTIYVKTDFMSFEEMNQFLRGYMFKSENRF